MIYIDPNGKPQTREADKACIKCGRNWADVRCCCSLADNPDGSHAEGLCVDCCTPHNASPIWDGKSVAGGTYERCE